MDMFMCWTRLRQFFLAEFFSAKQSFKPRFDRHLHVDEVANAVVISRQGESSSVVPLAEQATVTVISETNGQLTVIGKRQRKSRPIPSIAEIQAAKFLPISLVPLRYPGTTVNALRHRIFSSEVELRNARSEGREPKGFAKCIVREGRSIKLDCDAYEDFLRPK